MCVCVCLSIAFCSRAPDPGLELLSPLLAGDAHSLSVYRNKCLGVPAVSDVQKNEECRVLSRVCLWPFPGKSGLACRV